MQWYEARRLAKREALRARGGVPDQIPEPDILQVARDARAARSAVDDEADTSRGERDEYFRKAGEACIQHQLGSTSLLQRKLEVGYGRAARIIDQLHAHGVLGPPNGSKPREILMGLEEFHRLFDDP